MKTINHNELPAIGQPLSGGTFYAIHCIGDKLYALVYLDKECEFLSKWGEYGNEVEGCASYMDGLANTEAMAVAGFQAALKLNLQDGEYIPSYVEHSLLLAFSRDNPESGLAGWHWSSTQRSANYTFSVGFGVGTQFSHAKCLEFRVRPVRRLIIQ